MHSSILRDNPGLFPAPQIFPPLTEQYMALQPKRTWSAEDERRRRLEEDPDAYDVGPHSVTCAGCHRPIRLNATGRYYAANWNKHKMGCKNTNAANGANAMSAESKFTGRVAAFRVAKPTENSAPLSHSSDSGISSSQELNRIRIESARPPHPQSLAREPSSSWVDQLASEELPATFTTSTTSRPDQRASAGGCIPYHRSNRRSPIGVRPIKSGHLGDCGPQSSSLSGSQRSSDSPSGPSVRYEEQFTYGPIDTPFREELLQRTPLSSHGVTSLGVQRARANSIPSHHSENGPHHISYLPPHSDLPESPCLLDKAKRRRIEHTLSDSHSCRRYSPQRHASLGVGLRKFDRADGSGPTGNCEPLRDAQKWREGRGYSDLESSSTASPAELTTDQEGRPLRAIKSRSPRSVYQDDFDERVLPPLSSLSLTKLDYSGPASRGVHSLGSMSKVHEDSSRVTATPGEGYSWRERTSAWVQTGTTCLPVDRVSPESVVLPPIRNVSTLARGSPTGMRRRQREGEEDDDDSMGKDRPSPPKVVVLPLGPLRPSSALRTDDLSLEYKHTMVRSDEDKNNGGDLTLVGKQSQSGAGVLSPARQDTPRLHPVWKWEQKGKTVGNTVAGTESANVMC